jgi:hypothetical protein
MSRPRPLYRLAFSVLLPAALAANSASAARAQEQESQPHLTPQEIRLYHKAQTLIDWTPEQIRTRPELRELQLAESQQELSAILREVGERVAAFFDNFPNTTSTEEVDSELCSAVSDLCGVTFEGKFRYLLVARLVEGARVMNEYRTDAKGSPIDYGRLKHVPMLTYGFASAALQHFHPQNRMASRFRYFGRGMLKGQQTKVVGFAQVPEEYPPVTTFGHGTRTARLLVQGLAWIDAATHQILRIQTFLLAPRPDVGLEGQTTRIEYSAVQLPETFTPFWLPTKVIVDVWRFHRHFRNIHQYSDFKLFRVESRIGPVQEK